MTTPTERLQALVDQWHKEAADMLAIADANQPTRDGWHPDDYQRWGETKKNCADQLDTLVRSLEGGEPTESQIERVNRELREKYQKVGGERGATAPAEKPCVCGHGQALHDPRGRCFAGPAPKAAWIDPHGEQCGCKEFRVAIVIDARMIPAVAPATRYQLDVIGSDGASVNFERRVEPRSRKSLANDVI
jgi:hypothetical protein